MVALGATLPNATLILAVILELRGATQPNSAPTITLPRVALAVPRIEAGLGSTRVKDGADLRVITDIGRVTRAKSTPTVTFPKVALTVSSKAAIRSSFHRAAINLGVIIDVGIVHSNDAFSITHLKDPLRVIFGFGVALSKTRHRIIFELAVILPNIGRGVIIVLKVITRCSNVVIGPLYMIGYWLGIGWG